MPKKLPFDFVLKARIINTALPFDVNRMISICFTFQAMRKIWNRQKMIPTLLIVNICVLKTHFFVGNPGTSFKHKRNKRIYSLEIFRHRLVRPMPNFFAATV